MYKSYFVNSIDDLSVTLDAEVVAFGNQFVVKDGLYIEDYYPNARVVIMCVVQMEATSLYHMFANLHQLEVVELPDLANVECLDGAFMNCEALHEVDIHTATKVSMLDHTFYNCRSIKRIYLPETIEYTYEAFTKCPWRPGNDIIVLEADRRSW